MKISILLPYKENFSPVYPGAVSLFVNSMNNISKFKDEITVYGSTFLKERFSKNYVNISLKRNFLKSQTKDYVNKFDFNNKKDSIDDQRSSKNLHLRSQSGKAHIPKPSVEYDDTDFLQKMFSNNDSDIRNLNKN